MRLLQKISAGVLITFSLLLAVVAIAMFADPTVKKEERENVILAAIVIGVPPGALGGFLIWNLGRSSKKAKEESERKESERLQSIFYLLLKKHGGELTPLLFAMETKLPPAEAKQYLDQKAKEFEANFEVNDRGDITYTFNMGRKSLDQD